MAHKTKFLVLLLVVMACLLVYLLVWKDHKGDQSMSNPSEQTKVQEGQQAVVKPESPTTEYTGYLDYLTPQVPEDSLLPEPKDKSAEYEKLLSETVHELYSSDPYVEAFSVTQRSLECEFFKARNIEYSLNESDSGRVILNKKRSLCEQWQTDFPLLSSPQSWIKKLSELPADSKLGQLVKQFPSLSDFNQRTEYAVKAFELGIKEKSPYLIEYALTQIEQPFSILNAADNDLSTTDNGTYAAFIFSTAVNLMLCDFNHEEFCSGHGWKMINKCTSESSYCGLTYQEWFDRSLMPGMKQDVLVLLEYFQQIARGTAGE